jgi:ABC-2 type transport system permease protein
VLADAYTVMWKELLLLRRSVLNLRSLLGALLWLLLLGISPALTLGPAYLSSPLSIALLCAVPSVIGQAMAVNAFAGEREAHTLETLLASRLPDTAILLGKVAAGVVYSMLYLVLALVGGWVAANVGAGAGGWRPYAPAVLWGALAIGLLAAGAVSALGVLASLHAATAREAAMKAWGLYVLIAVLYSALGFLKEEQRAALMERVDAARPAIVLGTAGMLLVVLNLALMALAARRFKRAQLILD